MGLSVGLFYASADSSFPSSLDLSPVLALWMTAFISFAVNWLVSIHAIIYQTEKYFDLTGSITYVSCTLASLLMGAAGSDWSFKPRAVVQSVFVIVWAIRLGSFLYTRIKNDRKDGRFDQIKVNPPRFFSVWTIQGVWVCLTALPVFIVNCYASTNTEPLGALDFIGYVVWVIGFAIEVVADSQKTAFAKDPSNKGKFIETGLWYYSRHPNYFGETTLWTGQFISACAILTGAQWTCAISPLFVLFLLNKISGVPMLEKRADEKWGGQLDYELYKKNTAVFLILPKGKATELDAGNEGKLLGTGVEGAKV